MASRSGCKAKRLALLALMLLVCAACTTQTTGMQAPLPHDYSGVRWRPLDTTVQQALVVAPAYTALVENDPGTDAATLQERIDALPGDARGSELIALRVAIRPTEDLTFDADSTLEVRHFDEDDALYANELIDLTFDGDWAVIEDLPAVRAGDRLVIELRPGSGGSGWEFGYAVGLVPYGGSAAKLDFESEEPVQLGVALGFQTVFAQRTDTGSMFAAAWDAVADGLFGDAVLLTFYAVALLAAGVVLVARRTDIGEVAEDGR